MDELVSAVYNPALTGGGKFDEWMKGFKQRIAAVEQPAAPQPAQLPGAPMPVPNTDTARMQSEASQYLADVRNQILAERQAQQAKQRPSSPNMLLNAVTQPQQDPMALGPRMNTMGVAPGGGFDWQARAPVGSQVPVEALAASANKDIHRMGPTPSNFNEYKDAARAQQIAMNAGAQSAAQPGQAARMGPTLGPQDVMAIPGWNGSADSPSTRQQLAYAETLKGLQANKSDKMKAYDAELAHRQARAIANNAAGIRPSDTSRDVGLDRMLLAELTKGGGSPMGAVSGLQQANGPAGSTAFAGMSPTMQNIFAMRHPAEFAHIAGQRPDLAGQAALLTAQGQNALLKDNPGAAIPGFAEVNRQKKGQDSFDQGKLPPEHWEQFTPILSQLVPPAYKYAFASSRKKDAIDNIVAQYPNMDKTHLSAWYDNKYGKPWTN